LNKVFTSSDDIVNQAGTSVGQGAGFQYQKVNNIDTRQMKIDYNRDTAATFLSNPFSGLTKLFGHNKYMKTVHEAAQRQIATNNHNYADAQSDYLTSEYNRNHYNTNNNILRAATGLDS